MPSQEQKPEYNPEDIHKLPEDKQNELAEQARQEIREDMKGMGPLISPAPAPPDDKEPIPKKPRISAPQQNGGEKLSADALQDFHHKQRLQAYKTKHADSYPGARRWFSAADAMDQSPQAEQVTVAKPQRQTVASKPH
jgi:hypothetical protein